MVESDPEIIEVKVIEHRGKLFQLTREDPHGLWWIRHNSTKQKVKNTGSYTTHQAALKGIYNLPDSIFEVAAKKLVLTPRLKESE